MLLLTAAVQAADSSVLQLDITAICMRLLCAMVVGLVIGIEREYTHRPAGMRTHVLVSLGACAVMITGQLIFSQYHDLGASPDPARLAAQVIAGVGFLGAGTIMREGANVKGLTTAASLWCVACLGIAAGGGYYMLALVGMGFVFITLTVFELLQNILISPLNAPAEYTLDTADVAAAVEAINTLSQSCRCEIRNVQVKHLPGDLYRIVFLAHYGRGKRKHRRQQFFNALAMDPSVAAVHAPDDMVKTK